MGHRETVVFEDETGFTSHPRLGMGWAKKGKRLKIPTTSEHNKRVNVFGWVAPLIGKAGIIRAPNGNREGFLKCLRSIRKKLRGYRIWLYVDGARWHKGESVELFFMRYRIHCEYLPPYQPKCNLQERIWKRIRYEATTNRWIGTIDETWFIVKKTFHSWSPDKIKRLCSIT